MTAAAQAHAARAREFLAEVAAAPTVFDQLSAVPYQRWAGHRLATALVLMEILADAIDPPEDA